MNARQFLWPPLLGFLSALAISEIAQQSQAQEVKAGFGQLSFVDAVSAPQLDSVVSVAISADGRFLYAAAYNARAVSVLSRDAESGKLAMVDSLVDPESLDGVTALRLSPDNRYAASAAFRSNAVTLFSRDTETGKLTRLDTKKHGDHPELGLLFAIDAAWSPDSRFVYVIAPSSAALNTFRLADGQSLEFVETRLGQPASMHRARGIALSPDGRFIYVVSELAGSLVVRERDEQSGTSKVFQNIFDEQGEPKGLAGAFFVTTSPEGDYVYVSSGRFRGDDAVSVFRRLEDGRLAIVQELKTETDALSGFTGGNEILVSPDGKNAYAVASGSSSLVSFARDQQTGKLTQLQSLKSGIDGVGPLAVASGIAISPDGRFVYVAAEGDDSISVFQRSMQ